MATALWELTMALVSVRLYEAALSKVGTDSGRLVGLEVGLMLLRARSAVASTIEGCGVPKASAGLVSVVFVGSHSTRLIGNVGSGCCVVSWATHPVRWIVLFVGTVAIGMLVNTKNGETGVLIRVVE